jgi:hypothetical protein
MTPVPRKPEAASRLINHGSRIEINTWLDYLLALQQHSLEGNIAINCSPVYRRTSQIISSRCEESGDTHTEIMMTTGTGLTIISGMEN